AAFRGDGTFEVVGKGAVTVIDPRALTHTNYPVANGMSPLSLHDLQVHILSAGDRYDYKRRSICSASVEMASSV
ncbi:MAG: cyanophycinase, partial [Cyanobacteria bacterium P01_H01_bin.152]